MYHFTAVACIFYVVIVVLLLYTNTSLCRYSKEWEKTVKRIGRWIDFENDYKTLDPSFMESVWWVFSTLYKKGLVYQGFKVRLSPHTTAHLRLMPLTCTSPASDIHALVLDLGHGRANCWISKAAQLLHSRAMHSLPAMAHLCCLAVLKTSIHMWYVTA